MGKDWEIFWNVRMRISLTSWTSALSGTQWTEWLHYRHFSIPGSLKVYQRKYWSTTRRCLGTVTSRKQSVSLHRLKYRVSQEARRIWPSTRLLTKFARKMKCSSRRKSQRRDRRKKKRAEKRPGAKLLKPGIHHASHSWRDQSRRA